MCTLCQSKRGYIEYDIRGYKICSICIKNLEATTNNILHKLYTSLTALKVQYVSYENEINMTQTDYLDGCINAKIMKERFKNIVHSKITINKLEKDINNQLEISIPIMSISLLFDQIALKEGVYKKDILEIYNIKEKTFSLYNKHINVIGRYKYKYSNKDIYYMLLIQRYYRLNRIGNYYKLEKEFIAKELLKDINLNIKG